MAEDCWKRFCGEVCSAISQVAVEAGDRVVAGAVVGALEAVASAVAAMGVLAAGLVVETVLAEAARVEVGKLRELGLAGHE